MGRRTHIEQPDFPYHVSGRCINKEWFSLPMDELWEIFQEQLFYLHHVFGFEIHSFVLMNNHFHLLVRTPESNLSIGMQWFMKETSRYINQMSGRINQVWGGRYFRSMIKSPHHYLNVYKYIYYNPVEANISKNVLDYKYSSLQGLVGINCHIIPIQENTIFDMGVEPCLEWLNKETDPEHWAVMKKALKKSEFKLSRCSKTSKAHFLETGLL